MSLNQPQKISLEIELRHLDDALRNARRLMRAPEDRLLTRYRPVSEETHQQLEPLIEQTLAKIEAIAVQFQLPPQVEDVGRFIVADMAIAQDGLYDTLSRKLTRYGDVDPTLRETLDPHLQQLIGLTREIERIAVEDE